MVKYTDTTVFNVSTQTIVNTVNCLGVMGAGIALEFKLRFPTMYEDYVKRCNKGKVQIGRPYLYLVSGTPWIMNFPTKHHWRYPSRLEWIEQGLQYFVSNYERGGITSIAFPKLGASRGGLDWGEVRLLMEEYLQSIDIEVYICLNQEHEASGTEKVMTDDLNNVREQFLVSELGIRRDIARKLIRALPIHRFYELRKVGGVGIRSYEKVFKFFYEKALASEREIDSELQHAPEIEQIKLLQSVA